MVQVTIEMSEAQLKAEKKAQKKAKKEKMALAEVSEDAVKALKKEKKLKKRKLAEVAEVSAPDNEVEPAKKKIRGKKKSEKKAEKPAEVVKSEDDNASVAASATSTGPKHQKALDEVEGLSKKSKTMLEAKGFKTLFEIQHRSFAQLLDGNDMVGKAKTG